MIKIKQQYLNEQIGTVSNVSSEIKAKNVHKQSSQINSGQGAAFELVT